DSPTIAPYVTTVASAPSRRMAAWPIGTISSPSGTGPFARRYKYLCSKYTTGLSSRIAAFSNPLASYASDGATTFRPGRCTNQASGLGGGWGPPPTGPPLGARMTIGTDARPPYRYLSVAA